MLELEPEDSGHKLLSALTNNSKPSIVSVMRLSRSELKEIRIADNNKTTLAFDDWEVSEMINISSYFTHKRSENEDFQLSNIDPSSFENFKLSPICNHVTRTRKDMSAFASTRGQTNLSRPSISPARNINPEQETKPEPGGDSEPSPSINQLLHQMMDPSPITNGEGGHSNHMKIVRHPFIRNQMGRGVRLILLKRILNHLNTRPIHQMGREVHLNHAQIVLRLLIRKQMGRGVYLNHLRLLLHALMLRY